MFDNRHLRSYGSWAMTKLRDCTICGAPILPKAHQSNAARACSPMCAHRLAVREHPDINRVAAMIDGTIGPGHISNVEPFKEPS
jgi:hypothetical protein